MLPILRRFITVIKLKNQNLYLTFLSEEKQFVESCQSTGNCNQVQTINSIYLLAQVTKNTLNIKKFLKLKAYLNYQNRALKFH